MSDRFQFLRSYADVIQNVSQADKWLAGELALKIINYWIYWINEDSWNPMVEALFIQIKIMIDKWLEITDKNKENWMKWWRPKNPNKTQTKPNDNPNETETEPNIEPKKTKIENRKKKIENNNILISNDIKSKTDKSNPEINECLEIIKSFNGWMIDGTQKWNRIYGKNLIWKLKESPPVKNWNYTWQDTLRAILQVISQNKYHRSKITNPKSIYDNLTLLFQVCNEEWTIHKIEVL